MTDSLAEDALERRRRHQRRRGGTDGAFATARSRPPPGTDRGGAYDSERPPGAGTILTKRKPTKACGAPAAAAAADAEPVSESAEQETEAGSASPATALGRWRWFEQE